MKTVLVTGASGFIGTAVCRHLVAAGCDVLGSVRNIPPEGDRLIGVTYLETGDVRTFQGWNDAVRGCDAVIHLAARVHVMRDKAVDPLKEFRRINVDVTAALADAASNAGVKKFIFLSSIGVLGDVTKIDRPFSELSVPDPHNHYCRSKLEAELLLTDISRYPSLDVTVIRPPLVYGPRNPGNFLALLRMLGTGIPLPLASVKNRRSFIYVENLADAITSCIMSSVAIGNTYLVSDGEDLSTPELIRRICLAMGRPACLLPMPKTLLMLAAFLSGRATMANRLIGSLVVDSSKIKETLGWTPPCSVEEGLSATVSWFMLGKSNG
jgi:nucleoside-diphosphate-sugar epimerase